MPNYSKFLMYCNIARRAIKIRGILIYSGAAYQKLMVAGWPYERIGALNDNEAAP